MIKTEIAARRLHSQRLLEPAFSDPAAVVRWFGAMQAQEYPICLWAPASRLPATTETAMERALAERTILRTWPMRGTVHFVPAEDTRWMVELMASRAVGRYRSFYQRLGLTDEIFARSRAIFEHALRDGEPMTRRDLYALLRQNGIETADMRGVFIASQLAHQGLIVSGPFDGKQPTFVWLDAWAPNQRALSREEGLATIVRRYLRSHGPATVKDFVWWTGLTVADARAGLSAINAELASEDVDGQTYYWYDDALPVPTTPVVRLVPPFDEYLVAYKDRSAVIHPGWQAISPRVDLLGVCLVIVDGQVVGCWTQARKKTTVEVAMTLFRPLDSDEQAALDAQLSRYGAFLGLDVERV